MCVAACASTMSETLRFDLDIPASVRRGVAVPITLRVIDTGPKAVELYLRGRTIAFDIVVANAVGETVWHRLPSRNVPFRITG